MWPRNRMGVLYISLDPQSASGVVFTIISTLADTYRQILTRLSHPPDTKRLTGLFCVWPVSDPGCRYGPQLTALQPIYTWTYSTNCISYLFGFTPSHCQSNHGSYTAGTVTDWLVPDWQKQRLLVLGRCCHLQVSDYLITSHDISIPNLQTVVA